MNTSEPISVPFTILSLFGSPLHGYSGNDSNNSFVDAPFDWCFEKEFNPCDNPFSLPLCLFCASSYWSYLHSTYWYGFLFGYTTVYSHGDWNPLYAGRDWTHHIFFNGHHWFLSRAQIRWAWMQSSIACMMNKSFINYYSDCIHFTWAIKIYVKILINIAVYTQFFGPVSIHPIQFWNKWNQVLSKIYT